MTPARRERVPQLAARLLASRPVGAYRHLVLSAPEVAERAQPGQFVALAVGGPASATLLRRCFSIHRVDPAAGTVELVVASNGPGTRWLTTLVPSADSTVDLAGPLGEPFPLPAAPEAAVLVGGGYGSAPLLWLAERLLASGSRVELVLGAACADRLFGVEAADQLAAGTASLGLSVTTDDGSAGTRGWVSDVLPEVLRRSGARRVYGCGPMPMLEAVSRLAAEHGAVADVAVEESMACGVGVCMTCVLAVVGDDGRTRMARSCLEGPVFRGDRVRWDAVESGWGRVPADAVGAPAPIPTGVPELSSVSDISGSTGPTMPHVPAVSAGAGGGS